ncbi:MAG: coiled-coil domain-containing protein [Thermoanaerobaculum sp.]
MAWEAAMPVVTIPEPLRRSLGDEAAAALGSLLSLVEKESSEGALVLAEERFARRLAETEARIDSRITEVESRLNERITEVESRLNERIIEVESRLNERITEVESRLNQRITEEVSKLRTEMAGFKTEIIKWMFLFWLGQLVALFGLLRYLR